MIRLAKGLRGRGDEAVMIGRNESRWREECRRRNFFFEPLAFGGDFSPATWRRLRHILVRYNVHAIIAKGFKQARWARLARPSAAVAVKIPSESELGGGWFDRWTARRAMDRILTDNETACAGCRARPGWPREKFLAVHNGVEDPGTWPDSSRRTAARQRVGELTGGAPFVVAWMGRLHPIKAPDVAIRACAAADGDLALLMFGDGPLRGDMEALARRLGIADRVAFAGWRDDAREWLWGCDLFVNSSLMEGLPNAVLEAMAAGLPVAATDAGGTREAVADGVTGYLVPVNDAAALGRRIAEMRADGERRERFGAAGAARVRRDFTIEAMSEGVRKIMLAALHERRSGGVGY